MKRTAIISKCGRYRYQLGRHWDPKKPVGAFLMLNPSTADALKDDPTIRRCIGFAQSWGWGGLLVVNLFALRTPDPDELMEAVERWGLAHAEGPDNPAHLVRALNASRTIIAAWGKGLGGLSESMLERSFGQPPRERWLRKLRALKLNKCGTPGHPLYLPKPTMPFPWRLP